MTASSHHAQQTYGINILYTAGSYAMHDTPYRLLVPTYHMFSQLSYIPGMLFGIIITAVNIVSMVYWQYDMLLVCIHSRSYLRSVAQPSITGSERTSVSYGYSSTICSAPHRPYSYDTYHRYILRILV